MLVVCVKFEDGTYGFQCPVCNKWHKTEKFGFEVIEGKVVSCDECMHEVKIVTCDED